MGAVASAEAASADVTGVVVLSEQAAVKVQAPATRNNPKSFFIGVSQIRCESSGVRKPFWLRDTRAGNYPTPVSALPVFVRFARARLASPGAIAAVDRAARRAPDPFVSLPF